MIVPCIPRPKFCEVKNERFDGKIEKTVDPSVPEEGYEIELNAEGGEIRASSEAGFFYADKTLTQIEKGLGYIPFMKISDAPKYAYRGYMLDCSRHFFPIETVLKQIDVMADLKLNVFHWHLTDDQGWRIESEKYPLLNEVGSYRDSTRLDGVKHGGYYTKEEIRRTVKYCADRFIKVIPEIDMPGHFTSAIAAYPYLGCSGEKIKVSEHFGIHADIACAGKESTYEFIENLLSEVFELFPSEYIHLGGDEALKLHYIKCPDCQKAIKEHNLKDEEELQGYFLNRITEFCNEHGKRVINWNDGVMGGNRTGDFLVQYWKESKAETEAAKKAGAEVIFSSFFNFYLDYPCGMTPLKKTYKAKIDKSMNNVVGVEAPLWTEYVDSEERIEFMSYPRLVAAAERAWSEKCEYRDFINRLPYFCSQLEAKGVKYNNNADPLPLQRLTQVIKFFKNAYDKTLVEAGKVFRENKRAWKQKYGKKGK